MNITCCVCHKPKPQQGCRFLKVKYLFIGRACRDCCRKHGMPKLLELAG